MPRGKISRFLRSDLTALAFVRGEDVPGSYVFRFDRIVGYHGETPAEIGLRVGTEVTFELYGDRVDAVRLVKAS